MRLEMRPLLGAEVLAADVNSPPTDREIREMRDAGVRAIAVSGSGPVDLSWLTALDLVESLEVGGATTLSWPAEHLAPTLRVLALQVRRLQRPLRLAAFPQLVELEVAPRNVAGDFSELPALETLALRAMPAQGFGVLDGCGQLRVFKGRGRGEAIGSLDLGAPPAHLEHIYWGGVSVTAPLDGIQGMRALKVLDLSLGTGFDPSSPHIPLEPLERCPHLSAVVLSRVGNFSGHERLTQLRSILGLRIANANGSEFVWTRPTTPRR